MNRALTALLLVFCATFAAAQNSASKVKVTRAVFDRDTAVLTLKIEPTWHIYAVNGESSVGQPTKVTVDKPFEIAGTISEPKPLHHKKDYHEDDDPKKPILYTEEYDAHEGEIEIKVPVKGGGAGPVKGSIAITACDATKCLEGGSVKFSAAAGSASVAPDTRTTAAPVGHSSPDSRTTTPDVTPTNGGGHTQQVSPEPASRPGRKVVANPKRLGKFEEDDPFRVVEISYPDPITSDHFDLRVVVEIARDYHIYGFTKAPTGISTAFGFSKTTGTAPAVVVAQNGDVKPDPAPKRKKRKIGEDYDYFEGKVTFDVPMRAAWSAGKIGPATAEASFPFRLTVTYQTCTMEHCLAPGDAMFDLTATAVPATEWASESAEAECAALKVDVSSDPPTLHPDSKATLVARIRRADGKACAADAATAPRFELGQGRGLTVEPGATPLVTTEPDGSITMRLPIKVARDAPEAVVEISGRVAIGASTSDFAGSVRIVAPLLGFLLIAALAALAALLTPCVFPMIPVTMSFFTKQSETGQAHPAKLATVYCVGIIVSFTAIGALFTIALGSGDAANQFAGHWATQIVITALFVFFALSLLGMFDLSVPAPIMSMVERTTTRRMEFVEKGQGVMLAVLLMGLLFSITTFTCTAPFIGGLLAGAASSGWTRPILGMLVFSSVLAVPFFFLAVFPAQLKKLPKAGGWLNETKVVMGFIELAAAVKFVNGADTALGWGIFTRNICLSIWIAIHALAGLYLVGLIRLPKDMPRQKTGVIALLISMLFLTIAVYLATGLNGKPLGGFVEGWLPPIEREFRMHGGSMMSTEPSVGTAGSGQKTGWDDRFEDDYEGALAEAKKRGLPLFVDFTGFNCANCRQVEGVIFNKNPDVRKQLMDFVVVSLHLDGGDAKQANLDLVKKFGLPTAMPTYAVLDPTYTSLVNWWGSLGSDSSEWKANVKDVLQRWKTLKR